MATGRHAGGHDTGRGLTIAIAIGIAAALGILTLAESGTFSRLARVTSGPAIPGITIDADGNASLPVVTSVRTDSEAQKRGVRAGDDILAVDGRPVRDVAMLRAAVLAAGPQAPLDLHIRRGDAMWDVAIDRSEPDDDAVIATAATGSVNDAKNPAD